MMERIKSETGIFEITQRQQFEMSNLRTFLTNIEIKIGSNYSNTQLLSFFQGSHIRHRQRAAFF